MSNQPIQLPARTTKPRTTGLTAITDPGQPVGVLRDHLESYQDYIDIAKFGVGSAYLEPRLAEKLALYREFNIIPYFGGTLFEKFHSQNQVPAYLTYLRQHKVEWIEISNGTVDFPLSQRLNLMKSLTGEFKVIAEVGYKDVNKVMAPSEWIEELQSFLAAGASYVITEGRDSATAGIYRTSGEVREGLLSDILKSVDRHKIIFEAPDSKNQMFFIKLIGPDVNLGNVPATALLMLESQRRALRHETFFLPTT